MIPINSSKSYVVSKVNAFNNSKDKILQSSEICKFPQIESLEEQLKKEKVIRLPLKELIGSQFSNVPITGNSLGNIIFDKWIYNASQCIFEDPLRSILEIVVNGHDAQNPRHETGKFGMGFFSCLHFLDFEETQGCTITIFTTYQVGSELFAYRLTIEKKDCIYVEFEQMPPSENPGTTLKICPKEGCFSKESLETILGYIHYLDFFSHGKTSVVYDREIIVIGEALTKPVEVILSGNEISVSDKGTGISLETAHRQLLVPSSSSKGCRPYFSKNFLLKKALPAHLVLYKGKKDLERSYCILTMGKVIVMAFPLEEKFHDHSGNITDLYLADFPIGPTHLTPARNAIKFPKDENEFEYCYLKAVIDRTLDSLEGNPALVFYLYKALQEWENIACNQKIKGYFSGYLKEKLAELLVLKPQILPAPPLHASYLQKLFTQSTIIPLEAELVNFSYSHLESAILENARAFIAQLKGSIRRTILIRALDGEAIIGTRVIALEDHLLRKTQDLGKVISDHFGLTNFLFVPISLINSTLKKSMLIKDTTLLLLEFSMKIVELHSSMNSNIRARYMPYVTSRGIQIHDAAPRLITIEGKGASVGIKEVYWVPNISRSDQMRQGSSLLKDFSEEAISEFYDRYFYMIQDWFEYFGWGTENTNFLANLKKHLSSEYFRDCFEDDPINNSKNAAKYCTKSLFYCGEDRSVFLYDPESLAKIIENIALKYNTREILEVTDDELMSFIEVLSVHQEKTLENRILSKREVLGFLLYKVLFKFMSEKEMESNHRIVFENEILFPFSEKPTVYELEKLMFILMPHILSTHPQVDLISFFRWHSRDSEQLFHLILKGADSCVLKVASSDLAYLQCPMDDYDLTPILLKSKLILRKYPHLSRCFINFILAPISIHSTFESSKVLTVEQKKQLKDYRNTVLELYQQYFVDSIEDEEVCKQVVANPYSTIASGEDARLLKHLEWISSYPAIFSKFLHFQLLSMQDQLNPKRRYEDTKLGKPCFLPHVDINTPFGVADLFFDKGFVVATIVKNARNYREFLLICRCMLNREFRNLCETKDHSDAELSHLLEMFIVRFIHERISPLLIDEIYEETRLMKYDEDRQQYIRQTGIPAVFISLCRSLDQLSLTKEYALPVIENILNNRSKNSCSLSQWMGWILSRPNALEEIYDHSPERMLNRAFAEKKTLSLGKISQAVQGSERGCAETTLEPLQNSMDAIVSFSKKVSEQDPSVERSVHARKAALGDENWMKNLSSVQYAFSTVPSSSAEHGYYAFTIKDQIGIRDTKTLLADMLIPDYSTKNQMEGTVGQMGNGMAQIYQNARYVVIKTRLVNDPSQVYQLHITPVRDFESKDVVDLQLRLENISAQTLALDPSFFGTEIQIVYRKQPKHMIRLDLLSSQFYMQNLASFIYVTTALNQPVKLVERCQAAKEIKLLDESHSLTEYRDDFRFIKIKNAFNTSMVTCGGVPAFELRGFLKTIGVENKRLLDTLAIGYVLNVPVRSYLPVQTRTKLIISEETRLKIISTLLSGYYEAEFCRAIEHPALLTSMFMHFDRTSRDFNQFMIPSGLENTFSSLKTFFPIEFFTYFSPAMLQDCEYKSFGEYIIYGYDVLVKPLQELDSRSRSQFNEWKEKTCLPLLNKPEKSIHKRRQIRTQLINQYDEFVKAFNQSREAIISDWKKALELTTSSEMGKKFVNNAVIPWFEKKLISFDYFISLDTVLYQVIPALKPRTVKQADSALKFKIQEIASTLKLSKNNRKNFLTFINKCMQDYCRQYLKLLNHKNFSTINFRGVYLLVSNPVAFYRGNENVIYLNFNEISYASLGYMLVEMAEGRAYQHLSIYSLLFKGVDDQAGIMNHELEHALSSSDRSHAPGPNVEGKIVSFDACANSRSQRTMQNGLLSLWKRCVMRNYIKLKEKMKERDVLNALFGFKKMESVSYYHFAKYSGLQIKFDRDNV